MGVGVGVGDDGGTHVLPGVFVERVVGVLAVDPRDLGRLAVGQADPHLAAVVRVVVDLPLPASGGDAGGLPAKRAQDLVVVGAVVDADPAFAGGLPSHRQQLEVVAAAQRYRHVSARRDQGGPHPVRRRRDPGHHRMA
ncbi:hypothetical protein ACIRL2_47040 [Embleya sp. NPDC127516]|uniref:hypothetical protein n=1 Tax=Embleya sp. NPDC127516 TaxID=3363990 RepID=UPI003819ACC0